MANADHLVLATGVGAIVITITVGAVLYQPTPQADIRFETTRESYRMGEVVVARLENHSPFIICTTGVWPWSVTRHVGNEWRVVGLVFGHAALGPVTPGDRMGIGWVAESYPDWERIGLVEVLPGAYRVEFRGWLCGELAPEPTEGVAAFAYFELVA